MKYNRKHNMNTEGIRKPESGNITSLEESGFNTRTRASPKWDRTRYPWSKRPPFPCRICCKCSIVTNSVIRARVSVMIVQWMVSLHMVMLQNIIVHMREKDLILFYKILITTKKFGRDDLKRSLDISLHEKPVWKSHRFQNKTFVRG